MIPESRLQVRCDGSRWVSIWVETMAEEYDQAFLHVSEREREGDPFPSHVQCALLRGEV